jgi:hypothetical protein
MTTGDIGISDGSYPVDLDMSSSQFLAVSLGSDGYLDIASGAPVLGILQDDPNGQLHKILPSGYKPAIGQVREAGHSKLVVDNSNIVPGSKVKLGASGQGALSTDPSDVILGIAMETNSTTTGIIEVALRL